MRAERLQFADDGKIPNSPLPVIVYREVREAGDATACEGLFEQNGWRGSWRNGVYPFHHFHSIAHEALGVASGSATLILGGPRGEKLRVSRGDVLVLPAGTGHCNAGSSEDFLIVGAYPNGMPWDLRRGEPEEHDEVRENIRGVPRPELDPVTGQTGDVAELWSGPA